MWNFNILFLPACIESFPLSSLIFTPKAFQFASLGKVKSTSSLHESNNGNEGNNAPNKEDDKDNDVNLTWIQKAMGMTNENSIPQLTPIIPSNDAKEGISGFAVDPDLGFVVILQVSHDSIDTTTSSTPEFIYPVISNTDKTAVQSREALCLVQLCGGMDLGAAVFPPDTLAKLVFCELEDNEKHNHNFSSVEELRPQLRLLAITVLPNNDQNHPKTTFTTTKNPSTKMPTTSERDATICESSSKVYTSIRNLPGLSDTTIEMVEDAMQLHTDANGELNRDGYTNLLDTLRNKKNDHDGVNKGYWLFRLTVSLSSSSSINSKIEEVSTLKLIDLYATPFESVSLALRYNVPITVEAGSSFNNDSKHIKDKKIILNGPNELLKRFPKFRPIQELEEDAKLMDGFIPSMFFKPSPKNDDKI